MTAIHWRFPVSGLFSTPKDWNPAQVPAASDNVFIDAAGTYTVTSSTSHTVRTLTTVSTATLAVTGGTFAITNGTDAGSNAGTIRVSDGAALAIGGAFRNAGKITLNSTGHRTDLAIIGTTTLSGAGSVTLSPGGDNFIISNGSAATLVNASNTISGAGVIGDAHLTLINQAGGIIDGNSTTAALTLNTGTVFIRGGHNIANAGLIEGTTPEGLVIVSNVSNEGVLQASGTNARLLIDGTVSNISPPFGRGGGIVRALGRGAHVDLSSARIIGGRLQVGSESVVETVAGSGLSVISGVTVTNSGTLEANPNSELRIQGSNIGTTGTLMSNGDGALLDISGNVGAVSGQINGGAIEFKGGSAAKIVFTAGTTGTLKLDASTAFTGTVSGFAGVGQNTFTQFLAFGDSSVDSGSFQYLSTGNPNADARIQNALQNGGTAAPVGVGLMNSQLLAGDFGLTAVPAYAPGGGTNYAISGAFDAAFAGNGNTGNANPGAGLLSTADQISSYLSSTKDANGTAHADPNALYLISSGGNDVSYALNNFPGDVASQEAYVAEEAANLTAAIGDLFAAGAQHVIVDNNLGNKNLANYYSAQLFADLDAAGVPYIQSDVHAMLQDIKANPTAFGFAADAVQPGVLGTATESALIEPDTTDTQLNGWGLWGANTTTPQDSSVPLNQQYAYLRSADAEQTSLFSDDQHLSAAGQLIQANYVYGLLVTDKVISQDAIDLTDINYAFGTTKASYSGDATGGTLTVTDGTHTANIALLGNYMASTFVTASDGGTGTLVVDQSSAAQQILLAQPHGAT